jgi:hypothetical protein
MTTSKDTILYAVLALLAIGVFYSIYLNYQLRSSLTGSSTVVKASATLATTNSDSPELAVGGGNRAVSFAIGPDTTAFVGVINSVSSESISVTTEEGGVSKAQITSKTKIVAVGEPKTAAQVDQDLQTYNAKITQLMKDPEANKQALMALELPSTNIETATTISALKTGDKVSVVYATGDTAPVKTALKVLLLQK